MAIVAVLEDRMEEHGGLRGRGLRWPEGVPYSSLPLPPDPFTAIECGGGGKGRRRKKKKKMLDDDDHQK